MINDICYFKCGLNLNHVSYVIIKVLSFYYNSQKKNYPYVFLYLVIKKINLGILFKVIIIGFYYI